MMKQAIFHNFEFVSKI